ncbi:SDR family oxidoreductase [Nocardia miyunensis]|uniref:SDR family oxidoreductase n=1 Tax=Nocardia miyunensis TaxID=282684 RepID=UPI00082AA445|nr:SDR family oxidoreductase [Nocardia miyunensis]
MRIVIMGGTSGIGLAAANRLTAAGHEVTVTGRDPEKLARVKELVHAAESVDGTDEEQVRAFFDRIGDIDHLVLAFSPGARGIGPIRDIDLADLRAGFDGKLFAYLHAIQRARVSGSITMVSASSARAALPGTVTFAAVNGAIERVVSPLAAELAPIRVNAVSPGVVDTPWWAFLPPDQRAAQFTSAGQQIPAGRVGTGADVAAAIAYLVDADYVTGSILPVDGGFTVA